MIPAPMLGAGLRVHADVRDGCVFAVRITRSASTPSVEAAPVLARISTHLRTGREDLRDVPVDLAGVSAFDRLVLETLRNEVGAGQIVTYGELARRVGSPGAARAVGGAMARNPLPILVPCHRVLPSTGRPGNYSGEGGWVTKVALLRLEKAPGFASTQATLAL